MDKKRRRRGKRREKERREGGEQRGSEGKGGTCCPWFWLVAAIALIPGITFPIQEHVYMFYGFR